MKTKVALLRGINVGGKNILPMQDLRELLEELGCDAVATYVQSGNAVFRSRKNSDQLATQLAKAIYKRAGFEPFVLVLSATQFRSIASANPYADHAVEPKTVHTLFLAEEPTDVNIERMRERATATEEFTVTKDAVYLSAPDGIGRSKLAGEMERHLGVQATGRNGNTIGKLLEMLAKKD